MIEIEEWDVYEDLTHKTRAVCKCGWEFELICTKLEMMDHTYMIKVSWLKEICAAHEAGHNAEKGNE